MRRCGRRPAPARGSTSRCPLYPRQEISKMTYSIVAKDPNTGQLGVAVQSHWFSVGSVVTWAEAGVGAVATQSFVEASYGPLGLASMKSGKSPKVTLNTLLARDENRESRQVAMINTRGEAAVHTGSR